MDVVVATLSVAVAALAAGCAVLIVADTAALLARCWRRGGWGLRLHGLAVIGYGLVAAAVLVVVAAVLIAQVSRGEFGPR